MAYIGKSPAEVGQITSEDTFTATAGQTVFTLAADVERESNIIVSINGVVQTNAAFALSGTGGRTLTFVSGITLNDVVRVVHMGYRPTYISVQANSIDGTKIAMGSDVQGDFLYYNGTNYVRLGAGTSGQALISGGTGGTPSWGTAGGSSFESGFIRTNVKTNTGNITFAGTENGMTAGPITVANGTTITVVNGSVWTIV
jgi:hypothetical protein